MQRLSFRLDGCVARASRTITMGTVSKSRRQSRLSCIDQWKAVLWAVGSRQRRKRTPRRERRGRGCWQVSRLLDKSLWKRHVKRLKGAVACTCRYHFPFLSATKSRDQHRTLLPCSTARSCLSLDQIITPALYHPRRILHAIPEDKC